MVIIKATVLAALRRSPFITTLTTRPLSTLLTRLLPSTMSDPVKKLPECWGHRGVRIISPTGQFSCYLVLTRDATL